MESIRQRGGFLLLLVTICSALAATFYIAYITKNETILNMLAGAVIANLGQFVQYFVGTNIGSQRKTEIIAASQPPDTKMTLTTKESPTTTMTEVKTS